MQNQIRADLSNETSEVKQKKLHLFARKMKKEGNAVLSASKKRQISRQIGGFGLKARMSPFRQQERVRSQTLQGKNRQKSISWRKGPQRNHEASIRALKAEEEKKTGLRGSEQKRVRWVL